MTMLSIHPFVPFFAAASGLLAFIFILFYGPRKWWTHVTGVSIMATKASILLLSVAALAHYFDITGYTVMAGSAWVCMSLVMLWRVLLLVNAPPVSTAIDDLIASTDKEDKL